MKNSIVLVCGLLLSGASCSHAQPAPAVAAVTAPMTAMQILKKSRQTYAAFSVYKGSCNVVSDAVIAVGDGEPMQHSAVASAQIEFERGKSLTIEGIDAAGGAYKSQWTPAQTWLEMQSGRKEKGDKGTTEREIIGDKPDFPARDALFASLSGVTQGTGSSIPNALMPDKFDLGNPFSSLGTAKFLLARNLGNVPCYVIEQTVPELNTVWTYWIEQKTFLLRRKTDRMGEKSFDDLPIINGVEEPVMRMAYSLNQYIFTTTEAK